MRRTALSFTSLALLAALAAPASAAGQRFAVTSPAAHATTVDAARAHLESHRIELGLTNIELDAGRMLASRATGRVMRFAQAIGGVPVMGGGVVVHANRNGSIDNIFVDVSNELDVDPTPTLSETQARDALVDVLGPLGAEPHHYELVISRSGGGQLLWQIDVRDSLAGSRYWIDAHDGSFAGQRSMAIDAQGRVYTMNSVETPTPADVELLTLDETANPVRLNGWNGLLTVTNYVSGSSQQGYTLEQTLGPTSGTDFLYDPPGMATDPTDAFAQVNLFYHLTSMKTFFENLGVDMSTASWKITAVANALENGQPLDNAFFSPQGIPNGAFAAPNLIAIGQGTFNDFAYDSDVFKHEFGHYVSGNAINYNLGQAYSDNLGINPWSGSIDEGIADYFACSENNDAELGEASLAPLGAERDLTNTSKTCPNDMVGENHADGELIGSMCWSIREALGAGAADALIWGALETLNPGATFGDFGRALNAQADSLVTLGDLTQAQADSVASIITARGLDECDRTVTLDPNETSQGLVIGLDILAQFFGGTCSQVQNFGITLPSLFHYAFTPASTDVGITFNADVTPLGGGDLDYTLLVRAGQPVAFGSNQAGLPEPKTFDYSVDLTSGNGSITIDSTSTLPFDPAQTYYAILVSRSCPTLAVTFSAQGIAPTTGDGGGGAGGSGAGGDAAGGTGGSGGSGGATDGDGDDDGCDCQVTGASAMGSSTSGLGLLAGALGFAAIARRRRRG
ncbi:MAG: MYXO-CTERM sorting domain-containing protein [Polyangiaceae bacterium]